MFENVMVNCERKKHTRTKCMHTSYMVESTSKTKISLMLFISWQEIREYGNATAGRQSNASTLKQVTVYLYVPKNRIQIIVGVYKLCNYKITVLKLLETYFFPSVHPFSSKYSRALNTCSKNVQHGHGKAHSNHKDQSKELLY